MTMNGSALGMNGHDNGNGNAGMETGRVFPSAHGSYQHAAVTTDHKISSDIAKDIMERHGGNAVDAAIAAMMSIGAMCTHSGGVGGSALAVLYDKEKNGWFAVDARDSAPSGADETMVFRKEDRNNSGSLSIAVPGELRGAMEMHARFGTVPWKTLVMPTVKLLRDGFPLPKATWKAITSLIELPIKTGFEMLIDEENNRTPMGSIIKMPKLARTYQRIADDPSSFYNGSLAEDIVKDIQEAGGIITLDDLKNYRANIKEPIKLDLPGNMTMYSMPPPGSGAVMAYILSILSGYKMNSDSVASDEETILTYHRIIEAMKFAFAKRAALGDENFVDVKELLEKMTSRNYGEKTRLLIDDTQTHDIPYYKPSYYNVDDAGTTHMNVLDREGNAVSVTITINSYFGSKVVGSRTGIIFNSEMTDFSTPGVNNYYGLPPTPANFIKPGKRPMSSISPTLVWDHNKGRICLATGSAGASRITSANVKALIDILWFDKSVVEATDSPGFHHQLIPNYIQVESNFPKKIQEGLEAKGHQLRPKYKIVLNTIVHLGDEIDAASDGRKGGEPSGF